MLREECSGENGDQSLFYIEDPAARTDRNASVIQGRTARDRLCNRSVNIARGVKNPQNWQHLLNRCKGEVSKESSSHDLRRQLLVEGPELQQRPFPSTTAGEDPGEGNAHPAQEHAGEAGE